MICSVSLFAQQQGIVTGRLTDAATGEPLIGANVILVGTFQGSSTGPDGTFSFQADVGDYTMRATYIGYGIQEIKIEVKADESTNVDIALSEAIAEFGETVVIIGSRAERTAIETPVPVDVISEVAIRESPQTETNQVLAQLAPSFNASHQTISDGTDHIDPASLRGLGPDQVLVLINGKRQHQSSVVNVNGTFGRGTVGVDLNAIPKAAIKRIEVLRDGAAAQYGSDAIAGVINIVLKEQTSSLEINGGTGANNLLGDDDLAESIDKVDGETYNINGNYGFRIGETGFFNVTVDYLDRARTNRSNPWTGDIFPGISGTDATNAELSARGLTREDFSMKTGQGAAQVASAFFNTSVPLSTNAEFYSFGGLTYRNGQATGFFRLPNSEARVNLNVYPNGFLPEIHTKVNDREITAGLKGVHKGWIIDASVTHGGNSFQFNIENSINASIGESSPVSFDAGLLEFNQTTGNLDMVRSIDTGGSQKSLSVAFGAEVRVDNYQIHAGQFESYSLGNGGSRPGIDFDTTASGGPKNPGSQVFPGFQPSNEVNRYRNSVGIYADVETDVTEQVLLTGALRFENYSDFGSTWNVKGAARIDVAPNFALRGGASTGFRAPSLHQLWFNNVSIQFVLDDNNNLVPARVLSASNADPITRAFGVPQLKEETSVNVSAGFTARPTENFTITADVYQINIDDRIVLTSRFTNSDPIVAQILSPFSTLGVGQAQFFANAVDTRTQGLDIVTAYNTHLGEGRLTLSASANFGKTDVQATHIPAEMAKIFAGGDTEAIKNTLFNREERNRLEDALPHQKGTASARYTKDKFGVLLRGNYYGKIQYKPTNPANDQTFDAKVLLDLDLSYEVFDGVRLSVGANNILNTFPDTHDPNGPNYSNGRFVYSRRVTQFGMNGGFYYTRFSLNL